MRQVMQVTPSGLCATCVAIAMLIATPDELLATHVRINDADTIARIQITSGTEGTGRHLCLRPKLELRGIVLERLFSRAKNLIWLLLLLAVLGNAAGQLTVKRHLNASEQKLVRVRIARGIPTRVTSLLLVQKRLHHIVSTCNAALGRPAHKAWADFARAWDENILNRRIAIDPKEALAKSDVSVPKAELFIGKVAARRYRAHRSRSTFLLVQPTPLNQRSVEDIA